MFGVGGTTGRDGGLRAGASAERDPDGPGGGGGADGDPHCSQRKDYGDGAPQPTPCRRCQGRPLGTLKQRGDLIFSMGVFFCPSPKTLENSPSRRTGFAQG